MSVVNKMVALRDLNSDTLLYFSSLSILPCNITCWIWFYLYIMQYFVYNVLKNSTCYLVLKNTITWFEVEFFEFLEDFD